MSVRISIEWNGLVFDRRTAPREALEGGVLLLDGEPLPDARSKLVRASMLGTYRNLPALGSPDLRGAEVRRDVIPGLLARGDIPLLSGPVKVGKSTLIAQLCAALVIPGRRFLGMFEPAQFTDEENERDELNFVLVNAENPPAALHRELIAAGLEYDDYTSDTPFYRSGGDDNRALVVLHLEEGGGSDILDLTVPANFDEWGWRFSFCPCPDPSRVTPPAMVIVDGVTAIVGLERAAAWYGEFRRLMHVLDVTTALVAGHSGLGSQHAYGATDPMARPDGLWSYWTADQDVRPDSKHYLAITPRLDGPRIPKTRVILGEDGLLQAVPASKKERDTSAVSTASETENALHTPMEDAGNKSQTSWDADVLERLRVAGPDGLSGTDLTGGGGRYGKLRREAARRLLHAEKVTVEAEGPGQRWRLADAD